MIIMSLHVVFFYFSCHKHEIGCENTRAILSGTTEIQEL